MTSPKILLRARNLWPKKKLGQNFLSDPSTAEMIVQRSRLDADDVVVEIGAGMGALTVPVAHRVCRLHAVEKDAAIIPILKNEIALNHLENVTIEEMSILNLDIDRLYTAAGKKLIVIGNLPYNLSSQILVYLIRQRRCIKRAILMFQKELAERIVSPPGCKSYGRLSVMLQYCAEVKKLAQAKANLFYPRPKVDSEIIEVTFLEHGLLAENQELFLFKVIKAAFGQRRKNLKNALAGSELKIDKELAIKALTLADVDPLRRAETLQVSEFIELCRCLQNLLPSTSEFPAKNGETPP